MSRLKVIIVDDETLIRKLIRMKLDAERLDLEIVGEFADAKSALSQLSVLEPDIILSDICMPEVDGISFSEQCRVQLPDVKIIIITGYNDFEYARRSLKAGVCDYLMKPVQTEELNASIENAGREIRKEREERRERREILEERNANRELLLAAYLKQLLIGTALDENTEKTLQNYGVDTEEYKRFGMRAGILAVYESLEKPEILGRFHQEVAAFFQEEKSLHTVIDLWGRIVILVRGNLDSFAECLRLFAGYMGERYDYHIEIGVSDVYDGWTQISEAYTQAIADMQREHKQTKRAVRSAAQSWDVSEWEQLAEYMKKGKVRQAYAELEKLFMHYGQNETPSREKVTAMYAYLCEKGGIESDRTYIERKLDLCRCNCDIKWCMQDVIMNYMIDRAAAEKKEKGCLMRKIIVYLKANLSNPDLGISLLTERFSVSASFLNRLFKSYTGKTYSEILSALRYWKMLELLTDEPDMLDRDIGEQIGIVDAHYLSIWFRKLTSYSVTEYRKLERI